MLFVPVTITFSWRGSFLPFDMTGERDNPTMRHDWIDLRKEINRIKELPEVIRRPEWEHILLSLNSPECHFQTIGCHCDVRENEPLIIVDGVSAQTQVPQPWLASSYVQVGAADTLAFQSLDILYVLSGRLMAHLTGRSSELRTEFGPGDFHIVIAFEQLHKDYQPLGYVICVRCRAAGTSQELVIEKWASIMTEIAMFFALQRFD